MHSQLSKSEELIDLIFLPPVVRVCKLLSAEAGLKRVLVQQYLHQRTLQQAGQLTQGLMYAYDSQYARGASHCRLRSYHVSEELTQTGSCRQTGKTCPYHDSLKIVCVPPV